MKLRIHWVACSLAVSFLLLFSTMSWYYYGCVCVCVRSHRWILTAAGGFRIVNFRLQSWNCNFLMKINCFVGPLHSIHVIVCIFHAYCAYYTLSHVQYSWSFCVCVSGFLLYKKYGVVYSKGAYAHYNKRTMYVRIKFASVVQSAIQLSKRDSLTLLLLLAFVARCIFDAIITFCDEFITLSHLMNNVAAMFKCIECFIVLSIVRWCQQYDEVY